MYQRSRQGNRKGATKQEYAVTDPELKELIEPDLFDQLFEDIELLEVRERGAGASSGAWQYDHWTWQCRFHTFLTRD